jgi:hypothetical protein
VQGKSLLSGPERGSSMLFGGLGTPEQRSTQFPLSVHWGVGE